jgi:hypothetical protein
VRVISVTLLWLCVNVFVAQAEEHRCGVFMLAGECVTFDSNGQPRFTPGQLLNSAPATRAGFVRWAATAHGRHIIDSFNAAEYEVRITEDSDEDGLGRAPQPGIATLIAAGDHTQQKSYELVLNPAFFRIPEGMTPLPNQPVTPSDMMAAAWAGEMLHIWFYSQGISLPHHQRPDFQREWRGVAAELGMPTLTHDDEDERGRLLDSRRVIVLRSVRGRQ